MKCLYCGEVTSLPAEYAPCADCRVRFRTKVLLIACDKNFKVSGAHIVLSPKQFYRYTGRTANAGDAYLVDYEMLKEIKNRLIKEL